MEVTWDDVRKGDWLVVQQDVPAEGPRQVYHITWCGQVTEHTPKWTKLKFAGKEMNVPTRWGDETITKYSAKEFKAYIKENHE